MAWRNWATPTMKTTRTTKAPEQQQVAVAANTSHSYISRVEKGDHLPTLPVLRRILSVLDEELLITIVERVGEGEEPERQAAPVPELAAA